VFSSQFLGADLGKLLSGGRLGRLTVVAFPQAYRRPLPQIYRRIGVEASNNSGKRKALCVANESKSIRQGKETL